MTHMTTLEAPPRIALTIHQVKDLNLSSFSTQNDCKSCTCNVHCRLLLQHEDQSRTLSSSITKSRFFGEALSGHLDLYRSSVDENNWDVLKDSNIFQIEFGNQQDNNQNSLALNISLSLNKDGDLRDQSSIGEAQIPINQNELLNGDMKEWIDLMSQGGELVGRICVSIQTKKFLQKENNQLDPIYDALYNANSSPSPKEDSFYISIALKDVHNIPTQYAENSFWISYEFLDAIIQTVQFNSSTSSSSSFEPKEDVFQFSIKRSELPSFLQCNKIKIYICKEGGIIGSAEVDLFYAFCREDQNELVLNGEERYVEGLIELHSENGDNLSVAKTQLRMNVVPNSDYPQLFMSLSLSHGMLRTNQSEQDSLNSCSTINDTFQKEVAQHTFSRGLGPSADNKLVDLNYQTEDLLLQRAKSIATAEIELDKKQKQWEEFRHREEIKFREHLRKKEEVVRRHLDEQIKRKESQQMGVIKRCRSEYKELESRLKIALSEVETKEREMRRILAANNTTFIQKITELDLKEKLIREEAQHVVDMERAKSEATREQMKVSEIAVELAKKQATKAEEMMEQLRTQLKNSNEVKAEEDLQILTNRVEEFENQIEKERLEKIELVSQRDEYRKASHKLAKMLRQEKEKNKSSNHTKAAMRERKELFRIQKELQSLSIVEEKD